MLPGFTVTPMTEIIPDKVKDVFKTVIPLNRFADANGNYFNIVINTYFMFIFVIKTNLILHLNSQCVGKYY